MMAAMMMAADVIAMTMRSTEIMTLISGPQPENEPKNENQMMIINLITIINKGGFKIL